MFIISMIERGIVLANTWLDGALCCTVVESFFISCVDFGSVDNTLITTSVVQRATFLDLKVANTITVGFSLAALCCLILLATLGMQL